jgi:restriction system protein
MTQYKTILDAVLEVMQQSDRPMSAQEICDEILEKSLYEFNTDNPLKMVRWVLWNHDHASKGRSSKNKLFKKPDKGVFELVESSEEENELDQLNIIEVPEVHETETSLDLELASLEDVYGEYIRAFKLKVLNELKQLNPYGFERFGKVLLEKYGFHNVIVTSKSGDGGIDGYGELEMGMGAMKFGFQCKRYDKSLITPIQLREFRGSLDENGLSQGIFFTTSRFSKTAKEAATIPGARPIMLFDGESIVDLMLQKNFGVSVSRQMPIYNYVLNLEDFDNV